MVEEEKKPVAPTAPAAPVTSVEDKTKGIGIGALICAFVAPLIGLPLGIVGLVLSRKYQTATGQLAKGLKLAIAAIILSPILGVIYAAICVALIFGLINFALDQAKSDIEGTWSCKESSDVYEMYSKETYTFTKEGRITAEVDEDPTNNRLEGWFSIRNYHMNNGQRTIGISVTLDKYLYDGEDKIDTVEDRNENWEIEMSEDSDKMWLYLDATTDYICERE